MFRLLDHVSRETVAVDVAGHSIQLADGGNLAAALLSVGFLPFRTTPVSGAPRQPYCMMGTCFDCLVEIDGVPNRQACLETVREGMIVKHQIGAAKVRDDESERA